MARHESDREDLFAELAALSPRVEFQPGQSQRSVCAGRRESTGGWSLFFGPDEVYHFDRDGRLRRAYVDGFLYRSEGRTLSRLRRQRSQTETTLLRHDLTVEELPQFLTRMHTMLNALSGEIRGSQLRIQRVSPPDGNVVQQLEQALGLALAADPPLAPALRGP
ncbi:hypothetical protein Pan44_13240 [Caulifigura coniformis]|uniref:Uncharacterized protein n=1 Tax=Caulifigura coniformis TaxID=2527983 RepID=A0A517SB16_9PLAN|nr:hypothetical protein [Caulifigura coniformis]QDT53308.1 hypothetical protein Pan44_13240 [Caulifigura coniformis]